MKPARFTYERPSSLEDALISLAARRDEAKLISGGQSLAPMLNMRLAQPGHLIDINRLQELATISQADGLLVIGALARHEQIAKHAAVNRHCPLLAQAAATIGHYAIRQRGTIGGSLAHADPAAQLPLVALALDADIEARSTGRTRLIAAAGFFVSIFSTALAPDEILTAVRIEPQRPKEGHGFSLFNHRAGDFAIVAAAATLARNGAGIERLRIALGGSGPVPVRVEHLLPAALVARAGADWPRQAAEALAAVVDIEENERNPVDFRREITARLLRDVLTQALETSQ